jgi:hypothetical protein
MCNNMISLNGSKSLTQQNGWCQDTANTNTSNLDAHFVQDNVLCDSCLLLLTHADYQRAGRDVLAEKWP